MACIRLPWHDFAIPAECIRIYFDGAFEPDTGSAGCAVAVFACSQGQWHFAGCVAAPLSGCSDAYRPELTAATIACKMAFDFCKLHCTAHGWAPSVHFVFDALTVGKKMMGECQAISLVDHVGLLRGMWLLCEELFKTTLTG